MIKINEISCIDLENMDFINITLSKKASHTKMYMV